MSWIDESVPGPRLRALLVGPTMFLAALLVGIFWMGIPEGIAFLRDGLAFHTNGFWAVSFAAYVIVVFGPGFYLLVVYWGYWSNVVRVRVSDAGLHLVTRLSDRVVPWSRLRPPNSRGAQGQWLINEARPASRSADNALWFSLIPVGREAARLIVSDPRFPPYPVEEWAARGLGLEVLQS